MSLLKAVNFDQTSNSTSLKDAGIVPFSLAITDLPKGA
jgi:hypothetical protein